MEDEDRGWINDKGPGQPWPGWQCNIAGRHGHEPLRVAVEVVHGARLTSTSYKTSNVCLEWL